MAKPEAIVVGAGVGGLTAAAGLHIQGWSVRVLERAASLRPVGAAIGLAPNALRALDALGLGAAVRSEAGPQRAGGVRRPDGRWLAYGDVAAIAERFGDPVSVLDRARLIDVLAGALPTEAFELGTTVTGIDAGGSDRPARVTTTASSGAVDSLEADLVVAADGARSTLRSRLFPDHPGMRYAGYVAWRFVAPDLGLRGLEPAETWGRGARFATVPLVDGRWYCYGTANVPAGGHAADDERAELLRRFGDWHDPIPELLERIEPTTILRNDVEELSPPLDRFDRGRVALLGDAAHAMTPNLGQGGCQAIEDAVVLAAMVGSVVGSAAGPADLAPALARYTARRRPRTTSIVDRSRRTGAAGQWEHPVAVALRDAGLRLGGRLPGRITARALSGVYGWQPPVVAAATR